MKLIKNATNYIIKDKNGENVPHLVILFAHEVILVHCNLAQTSYQQNSRVLYVFVPNK